MLNILFQYSFIMLFFSRLNDSWENNEKKEKSSKAPSFCQLVLPWLPQIWIDSVLQWILFDNPFINKKKLSHEFKNPYYRTECNFIGKKVQLLLSNIHWFALYIHFYYIHIWNTLLTDWSLSSAWIIQFFFISNPIWSFSWWSCRCQFGLEMSNVWDMLSQFNPIVTSWR